MDGLNTAEVLISVRSDPFRNSFAVDETDRTKHSPSRREFTWSVSWRCQNKRYCWYFTGMDLFSSLHWRLSIFSRCLYVRLVSHWEGVKRGSTTAKSMLIPYLVLTNWSLILILQAEGINMLFVLGGNGTHAGAHYIHEEVALSFNRLKITSVSFSRVDHDVLTWFTKDRRIMKACCDSRLGWSKFSGRLTSVLWNPLPCSVERGTWGWRW